MTGAASDTLTEPAVERLRQRCEALRRLTTANNAALDLIADLQSKGSGEFVFDVAYLRAICDRAVALGQEAVDAVTGLTGSPERQLEAALARLRAGLEDALGERTALPDGPWLATLDSASDLPEVLTGKKVRHLSLVRRQARLPVPDGYVITAAACQALLAANGLWPAIHWDISRIPVVDRKALMGKSAEIQAGVRAAAWPQELADAVCAAFDDLARRSATAALRVSVRSSAFDQDGDFSFAGQFESVLNVDRAGLLDACLRVLASQFGFRAVIYYKRLGSDAALRPMAIGVVRMVNAQSSGVLYTRVPDQPSDEMMLLSGTWGLGPSTVGGTVAPDVFLVSRSQPFAVLDAQIGAKTSMQLPGPSSGLVETEVPGWMQRTSCLTRDQASLLASYGRRLEDHGGTPQDIEWAVDADDHVIVLQSRPLVLRPAAGADVAALRTGLRPLLSGGIRTSRGVGAGPVELVDQPPLRHDIPPGRVIVSGAAAPELSAVLERASALVTETGAVASHLATVARELGVPALFGVRQAREVLRAGQLVTVDAEFGDIFDGRIEALVSAAAGRHADEPPPDTPLGRKLAAVHAALVPLNLVAPRAPTFKPSACRTLHDILRYAHEKAVRELLRAGRGRPAALPLESPMPVNFYVLDLGRAVGTAPDAASVRPEQVASRPFTALWRGMSQIPWNRAPAGGVGGLAQLMARQMTSANRSAEAAAPNYVMVTPSYLNMTFRLGYHVSTVDAYLAQRARDNYASLVFQGGAADAAGRSRRLDFVAAILADRGWQTARRSDALFARTDALSPAVLTGELETLGRLLVVTRQTDVAFDTDERTREAVAAFKAGDLSLGLGA